MGLYYEASSTYPEKMLTVRMNKGITLFGQNITCAYEINVFKCMSFSDVFLFWYLKIHADCSSFNPTLGEKKSKGVGHIL